MCDTLGTVFQTCKLSPLNHPPRRGRKRIKEAEGVKDGGGGVVTTEPCRFGYVRTSRLHGLLDEEVPRQSL